MKINLEEKIKKIKTKQLTEVESSRVWDFVDSKITNQKQGFFTLRLLNEKFMIGAIIAIMLVIGGGFTVQAADNSKPGDWLFPLDRAIENVQIKLAADDKKQELKLKFAGERVEEVLEIASENKEDDSSDNTTATSSQVSNNASSSPAVLRFNQKIKTALGVAVEYLDQIKTEVEISGDAEAAYKLNDLLNVLSQQIENLPPGAKFELKLKSQGDKLEFELESKNQNREKQQVELKLQGNDLGAFQVKYKGEENDDNSDDEKGSKNQNQFQNQRRLEEIEVKVFSSGQVLVKADFDDNEDVFYLDLKTAEEIVRYLSEKYNLSEAEIKSVFKIEYENLDDDSNNDSSAQTDLDNENDSDSDDANSSSADEDETGENSGAVDFSLITKIEAEAQVGRTKVHAESSFGWGEEFYINASSYEDVVDALSVRYGLGKAKIESMLKFEVSD